jgi:hypothetical protein
MLDHDSIPQFEIAPILVPLTKDDLQIYIKFKILDSISHPGTYKKFMLARKDQGIEWAVDMNQRINNVQTALKELERREQEIKTTTLSNLHMIWQHVAESNLPPLDLQLTIANCVISQKQNIPCVVIKGKGRGAHPFTVNSKFAAFLHDLWVIYKLDLLIKTFARQKLDEIDPQQNLNMSEIGKKLETKSEDIHHLAGAFYFAFSHVYKSAVYALQAII